MKLGLQGHSVFLASGDNGVGGPPTFFFEADTCLGPNNTIFNPAWPNNCPYVTNVGATKVTQTTQLKIPKVRQTIRWENHGPLHTLRAEASAISILGLTTRATQLTST